MYITDTSIQYSGGSSNPDQSLSLGGVISSVLVSSQPFVPLSSITGATILEIGSMDAGDARFSYSSQYKMLSLQAPNTIAGPRSALIGRGDVTITLVTSQGREKGYAILDIIENSLPVSNILEDIAVSATPMNTLFSDVNPGQAATGVVQYRCIYIKNNHPTDSIDKLSIYLETDTEGDDTTWYAIDTDAGVGDGVTTGLPATLADENDSTGLLTSLTFSNESDPSISPEVTAPINPGQTIPVWVKRIVPEYVSTVVDMNTFTLGMRIHVDG